MIGIGRHRKIGLGFEEMIKAAFIDPCPLANVTNAYRTVAAGPKQIESDLEKRIFSNAFRHNASLGRLPCTTRKYERLKWPNLISFSSLSSLTKDSLTRFDRAVKFFFQLFELAFQPAMRLSFRLFSDSLENMSF